MAVRAAAAAGLLIALGACAAVEPLEYTEVHDLKPGPGLFTGDDGEWILYGEAGSPTATR